LAGSTGVCGWVGCYAALTISAVEDQGSDKLCRGYTSMVSTPIDDHAAA
jgi:hypothetical protein